MSDSKVNSKAPSYDVTLWHYGAADADTHPVKICVYYNPGGKPNSDKRKYYPFIYAGQKLFLSKADWTKVHSEKPKKENLKIRQAIDEVKLKAKTSIEKVLQRGRAFSFPAFEREFLVADSKDGFLAFFERHNETLRQAGRIGTYRSYGNSLSAFKAFRKEKDLSPFDITPELLTDFDAYLLKRKRPGRNATKTLSRTTIRIYMQVIKTIYLLMADDNPELLKVYPLSRRQNDRKRYKLKPGSGRKGEALTVEQLQKFIAIEVDKMMPEHLEAKLYFLFSFHCQGMNMRDVFLLKYSDIQGQTIRYVRHKTKLTETKQSVMEIPVTDSIRDIISKIGNPDKRTSNYVFTAIPNGLATHYPRRTDKDITHEERLTQIIQQKIKMINDRLKFLCKGNGLPEITTYWSRHSYSNLLRESGVDIEIIREMLGHSDIRTTESYLKRFDLETRRKANQKIADLLKVS